MKKITMVFRLKSVLLALFDKISNRYQAKPWGYYLDLWRTKNVVLKKIVVTPGQELSYQYHNLRDEFWYIKSGSGRLVIDCGYGSEAYLVGPSHDFDNVLIEKGVIHTVINIDEEEDLVIYETQVGICDEEDIVRLSDKYGR